MSPASPLSSGSIAVSAPGKLILMGEHAVVYGRPALVAAIDLRLTARFSSQPEGVSLELADLGLEEAVSWQDLRAYARHARETWQDYARHPDPEGFRRMRGGDPAHVVKIALGETAAHLESRGLRAEIPLRLRVESGLPIGSGFGSSAAASVAVVTGYLHFAGAGLSLDQAEALALEVERRQHGTPSGVDTAAVLRGGVLWARKLAAGGLETESAAVRSPLLSRLRVYDTGMPPEPTGAVVAAVRARRERDPDRHERLLDRMEAATRALRDELASDTENPERTRDLLREHQACLEELDVVPEPVRTLVRRIEAAGGAAKISGAGSLAGPGAGSLLVYDPSSGAAAEAPVSSNDERFAGWSFLQPFPYHPVHLGAEGLRRETL